MKQKHKFLNFTKILKVKASCPKLHSGGADIWTQVKVSQYNYTIFLV